MRHTFVRAAAMLILVAGATRAIAFPTGAIPTRTGARGIGTKPAEPNCTVCHTPNLDGIPSGINDPSGSLHLLDVPTNYALGAVYTIRVVLHHDWAPMPPDSLRWGFQLQAISAATGDSAGAWVFTPNAPPDSFKIVKALSTSVYKNRRYVDQAGWLIQDERAGGPTHYGEVGQVEWHVKWQAPGSDIGKIYFFAAGNSTNGDDQCTASGDYVFTTAESTTAGGTGAVGDPLPFFTRLETPTPNPMHGVTDIGFSIAQGGIVDLAVFDLAGREVRSLIHDFREVGAYRLSWDGRNDGGRVLKNSVYFVRLRGPDQRAVTRKVTLAR